MITLPTSIRHGLHGGARRAARSFAATTLALFILATLVPLGLALVQTTADLQAARAQAQRDAGASARVAAQDVNGLIDLARGSAATASQLDGFWSGSDADRDHLLAALAGPQPRFNALLFYTPDLAQHGSSNPDTRGERPSISGRAYAREALASDALAVTAEPLRTLAPPYTPVLPMAVPVHGPAGQAGLVVVGLKLERLPAIWNDVALPAGSAILLVDARTGTVLASNAPASERIGTQLGADELQQPNQPSTADAGPRQDVLTGAAAIDGLPWQVRVEVPAASVFDSLYTEAAARALTSTALALISLALLVVIWRRIIARLGRLQRAAAAWGAGELAHRVNLASSDELGEVGAAFDRMADELQRALAERDEAVTRAVVGEQQTRMLLEQASDAILISRGLGQYVEVNARACALLGYERDELLGLRAADVIVPDKPLRLPASPARDEVGEVLIVERRVRRKDGTIVPVEVSARLLADGQLQAIVRDISARKRAEAAQRQHAEHLARIIQVQTEVARTELQPARLMDLIVDRVKDLTGADSAVVELVEGDEMVYAAANGIAGAHAGLRLRAEGSFSGLCARTGQVLRCADAETDPRVDRAACQRVGVRSMVVAPLNHEGQVAGVLKVMSSAPAAFDEHHTATLELLAGLLGAAFGHAQAFSEQTRAEAAARATAEQLAAVLSAATESAIIGVDLERRVTFFSAGAERMLGYAASEVVGQPGQIILDPDQVTARAAEQGIDSRQDFADMVRASGAHTDEWTYIRKDGSRVPVSLAVTGMHAADGRLVGFVSVATDISARKAIEQIKDEFISVVSHELRTPLTGIRGSLGLLAGGVLGELPPRGQRMLEIAVDNTDRLLRLVNDMLDLERLRSGRIELRPAWCALDELLVQAIEVMRSMAEAAGVQLECQPVGGMIWADADRLLQVLTNLLNNAIKFSEPGTQVELAVAELEDGVLRIEVRDQGRGIPPEHLESIFERFQQVDASDARAKGGTGLGLAICRTIVEQHGGRIWAESRLGQGSTIMVELRRGAAAGAPPGLAVGNASAAA